MQLKKSAAALIAAGMTLPGFALATNGMLMEGYGPIATGMGGAAMAHDNGNAAMANNPATLGLMDNGSRLDVMLGHVGPDVSAPGTMGASSADAFYMPAFGFVRKQGQLSYGVGIYGQGGMGTDYANGDMAQVGVGRVILPLAYSVDDRLNIGGSIDIVWAGMDLAFGMANIDFQDGSDYTGAAKGYGVAAKLGFTYKLDDTLTLGAVYQTAGNLGDLKGDGYRVEGFDMPAIVGLGLAWQATPRLLAAFDVKDVLWSGSMNTVTVHTPGGPMAFQQDWNDQIVVSLGFAYRYSDALTLRAGFNHGKNPIPSDHVSALWPAIVEDHYTLGLGYVLNPRSQINLALTFVPEVSVTGTGAMNAGMRIDHSQFNWQLMYSYAF